MNVSIPPELEAFIASKVASGHYTSASEVVHEALLLLEECDQASPIELDAWLHDQITPAFDAMQAAPERAISADVVFDAVRARHANRVKRSA